MNLFANFQDYAKAFLDFCFPRLCPCCEHRFLSGRAGPWDFCLSCEFKLRPSREHWWAENLLTERFWGRCNFLGAAFLAPMTKGGVLHRLVHQLKYGGRADLGLALGRRLGLEIEARPWFKALDAIVPVPLHPQKLRQRGYNQAAYVAQGLGLALKVPVWTSGLERRAYTQTQTKKARLDRFANVQKVFQPNPKHCFEGAHILLVDDVVTTGATLEACSLSLRKAGVAGLSLAALGLA